MHRALAAWLIARPSRAAFACALCSALAALLALPLVVAASAIPVLVLLHHGLGPAFGIALAGAVAATLVWLSSALPSMWMAVLLLLSCCVLFGSLALAAVLRRTSSMNFCVQLAVLAACGIVMLTHAAVSDPAALWRSLVQPIVASMVQLGLYPQNEAQLLLQLTQAMTGMLAAMALVFVLGGLFLGRWWDSLLCAPGRFGREYRGLRLGVVLGTALAIVFVLLFLTESLLIDSLAWVGLVALVLQGLAAAHRSKANGSLNKRWLVAIYVALIVPLWHWIMIGVLAVWGFIDNWRRPKAQDA